MSASLLVLVPVALFVAMASLCFVGCTFDTSGLGLPPFTNYGPADVAGNPNCVAFWPLGEPVGATTAIDVVGTALGTPNNGTYTSVDTDPALFPCPAFELNPTTHSAFAPGTLTLGTEGICPGDTVQPANDPANRTPAMQVDGGFVTIPVNATVNPAPPFTIEAWVRPEWDAADPPALHMFIESRDAQGAALSGYGLWVNEDGNWEATFGVAGMGTFILVTAGPATLSATTHVVLTYDGTNAALFTDGLRNSPLTPVPSFVPNTTVATVFGVGLSRLPPRTQPSDLMFFPLLPFKGKIQNVAIYNIVLSDTTIMLHRDHGNGVATPAPP